MSTATDAPFSLSSLVGEAGAASNGELLVNSLLHHYPPELKAALLKRENERLLAEVSREDLVDGASRIVGRKVESATIRGGEHSDAAAVVTYAYTDGRGDIVKGFFPYDDLGESSSRGHVSQKDSLASSPAARDYESAQAKARASAEATGLAQAEREAEELRAQVADLETQVAEQAEKPPLEGNATEIAAKLRESDRAQVERVLEFERAHDDRSTVMNAAEKRLEVLDDEDQAAAAAAAAQEAENEALRARVAELEAQVAQPPAAEE